MQKINEDQDVGRERTSPFRAGLERHIVPAGNDDRVVTKTTSDQLFGSSGLGFKDGFWTRLISWLARNGIQEQTGSKRDETDIENCVKGWGQGPFSSRVFDPDKGVDQEQTERLIEHFQYIASKLKIKDERINDKVMAAFVASQEPRLYSTWTGLRVVQSLLQRLGARFRGHIQWQSLCELCGQVDGDGVKHLTPGMIRVFFNTKEPFFDRVVERRQLLRTKDLKLGDPSGLLADAPQYIDLVATDKEYLRNKSGLRLVAKIFLYMIKRTGSGLLPLSTKMPGSPTHQYAMAVVVPVKNDRVERLREQLAKINEETKASMRGSEASTAIPFHKMESLHYARFVLIKASKEHRDPALLVLSTNYDGAIGSSRRNPTRARAAHIHELVEKAYEGLDKVYACCDGYEPGSPQRLEAFLAHSRHQIPAQTFYVGSSGRSRQQIIYETELRTEIEKAADRVKKHQSAYAGPQEIRGTIVAELKNMDVTIPPPFPPQPDYRWHLICAGVFGVLLVLVAFRFGLKWLATQLGLTWLATLLGWTWLAMPLGSIGVLLLLAFVYGATLHIKEKWLDEPDVPRHDKDTVKHTQLASVGENEFMQNQLTHLVDMKDGWFRLFTIKFVFFALQMLATYRYNKGRLGNIPSIHFARWFFLGGRRRVLFFSNFDNSWQSYLGDFVDQASSGLTAVWSNTKRYPRTKWLLKAGSRNATSFLAWTRAHQLPTDVWYSAYPALTLRNLNTNTLLRRGLTDHKGVSARDWLHALAGEDVTQPGRHDDDDRLPVHDIQGIILKGYGFLEHAAFVMLKVEKPAAARKWLAQLPITPASGASNKHHPSASARKEVVFVNLAFSYDGLKKLGLDKNLRDGFPVEFIEGSHNEERSRVLGDTGKNRPGNWKWGNDKCPTHVLLMLYCHTGPKLEEQVAKYEAEAKQHGLAIVGGPLRGGKLPGRKEHFGFRDGIAQPYIRGNPLNDAAEERMALAPGEFLLGYPDGYHTERDKGDANIAFAPRTASGFEFCKGGSFLVFRQLEQNVSEFWQFFEKAGERAGTYMSAIELASKAVGRWPNGAPLVLEPESPRNPREASDDDTFSYMSASGQSGASDEHGRRCPLGAHIRRTNPRDWLLGDNPAESARLSSLHRIIRRGRPYGPPLIPPSSQKDEHLINSLVQEALSDKKHDTPRGLCFICFNANIERQFEFVQQQWINNAQFGVLPADVDPVMGVRHGREVGLGGGGEPGLTVQAEPLRERYTGLNDFVSVVGSGYFFMPPISSVRYLEKI